MAAAHKLLINLLVAGPAIPRGHLRSNCEAVVLFLLLGLRRLVAIETGHARGGMLAHFVFVNHGVLLTRVALGALAGGPHEVGI